MRTYKKKAEQKNKDNWLGSGLQTGVALLEVLADFFVFICIQTAAAAAYGAMFAPISPPIWCFWLPFAFPLLFAAIRRWIPFFIPFLLAHVGVAVGMVCLASVLEPVLFWRLVYLALGVYYAFQSIKMRISESDGEHIPPVVAVGIAVLSYFICSYAKMAGGERILHLALLYVPLWMIQKYLRHYLRYVGVNRSAVEAMPERSILRAGMWVAALCSIGMTLLLWILTGSSLPGRLTAAIGRFGNWLLWAVMMAISSFSSGEVEEMAPSPLSEINTLGETLRMEAKETPLWLEIIGNLAAVLLLLVVFAGLCYFIFLGIRAAIRNFYSYQGKSRQVLREGFVEEEQRIGSVRTKRKEKLSGFGGSVTWRIRKSFWKTLLAEERRQGIGQPANGQTARELTQALCNKTRQENLRDWESLLQLYEKARYGQDGMATEDARQAGRLSKKIRKA